MRKLLSTKYSAGAFNTAMLLLRIGAGVLMMQHGYSKLIHFSNEKATFINFFGIGQTMSLALVVFAEFFCSLFLIIGLFTRLSAIPLIITMLVAIFKIHNGNIIGNLNAELAVLYLVAYLVILLCGPGKVSIDGMMGK